MLHSAIEHCSFLTVFPAPLRKPPSPSNPLRVLRSKASTSGEVLTPPQNFTLGFIRKETVVRTIVRITIERKKTKASPSRPRQGVPPPAKRLSCGRQCYGLPFRYGHDSRLIVASAPLTPLRAAVPFACSHRLGGSTSCSSRQPHKPKLLPFAASVAPWAFSPPQTKRPQLHRECPALRGLTTTFRSDGQTTAP